MQQSKVQVSVTVSVLTGSACGTQNGRGSTEWSRTHVIQLPTTCINHWAKSLFWSTEKNCIVLVTTTIYSPSPREGTKQVLPTLQRAPALPTHLGGEGSGLTSSNIEQFFCVQDFQSQIAQVEYQEQTRFFPTNLFPIHFITLDINWTHHWSWKNITLHNFCSMLVEQVINLGKVRSENLKFRTDLLDQAMDGWSVIQ